MKKVNKQKVSKLEFKEPNYDDFLLGDAGITIGKFIGTKAFKKVEKKIFKKK